MTDFIRENKYIVIKRKALRDLSQEQYEQLMSILWKLDDRTNYVVVKESYPEYEVVWKAIEERVTKGGGSAHSS